MNALYVVSILPLDEVGSCLVQYSFGREQRFYGREENTNYSLKYFWVKSIIPQITGHGMNFIN